MSDETPLKESEAAVNKLITAPFTNFELRGANYLKDKKKFTAKPPMFHFVDLRSFVYDKPITHVAATLRPIKDLLEKNPDREFFVVNRMLPTSPPTAVVTLFVRKQTGEDDAPFELALERYKQCSNEEKDLKLKYICKIPNAPFMLRGAVATFGGFRPVIMGKGYLEQHHFSGPNYIEVDVDVGSSRIARGIMGVVVPQLKKLIVDEAFLIESQRDDELPERFLGLSRGVRFDIKGNNEIQVTPDMLVESDEDEADEFHDSKS